MFVANMQMLRKVKYCRSYVVFLSDVCVWVCVRERWVYPSSSLGWRYGLNGNLGHIVNLIKISGSLFRSSHEGNLQTGSNEFVPPPTRWTAIGGYPKVASYDMLSEQLHYANPVPSLFATRTDWFSSFKVTKRRQNNQVIT